jgi:hypothetical protein
VSNRRVALKYLEESQLLGEVLYLRELAPMVNKMPNMLDWKKSNFEAVRLDLKEQGLKAGDFTTVDSCKKRFGHEGQERDLEIIRLTDKNGAETFIAGVTPKGQEADIVNPPKVVLTKEKNKITARSSNDVNISSAIDLYVQQTEGLQAHKRALEEGKQAQMLVYATGTGKSFIMVEAAAARGKGIYVVPDIKLAAQLKGDIETLDEDHKTGNIITSARQNQNPAEILAAKHLIITKNDLEDYTRILKNETIYLDEAHEYPKHQIEKLLENGNTVLAVTATPTHELAEIFGNPIASITMDTALNKLNAFRDVKVSDPKQFDKSHDRDERVHQILLDYYKGLTFIENDRLPPDDKILSKYTTLENELIARGVDGAIERVMNANKEPRSGSMNMVFSTNQDLNRQITDAYNAVFEGTYSQQERLAQEVSEERAKISIAETMRLTETRDSIMVKGLANTYISTDVHTVLRKIDPSDVDLNSPDVQKKYASVIELSTVDAQGLKDEVQTAMKQQIANRINREAIGILRGNEGAVRNFQVRGRYKIKNLANFV